MRTHALRLGALFILLLLVLGAGCLPGGGGGGTGGGSGGGAGGGSGGGASFTFTKGFVFVRKDDRNLYVANASDPETPSRIVTGGGCRQPSLSKDGRTVGYVRTVGTDTEIATVAVSGGTTSTVFASTATVKNLRNPVFSPAGTKVAFAYDSGASSALGIVNLDGTGFVALTTSSSLSYASPSFMPDGLRLLAAAGSSGSQLLQIETVDAASGSAMNVASTLGNEAQTIVNRLVVSPDGLKAAFDGRVSSGSTRVFVIDLGTKKVTKLTDYPGDPNASDAFPAWVGSDKVTFSSDTGGSDQVYVLPASAMNTSGGLTLPSAIEPWYGPN